MPTPERAAIGQQETLPENERLQRTTQENLANLAMDVTAYNAVFAAENPQVLEENMREEFSLRLPLALSGQIQENRAAMPEITAALQSLPLPDDAFVRLEAVMEALQRDLPVADDIKKTDHRYVYGSVWDNDTPEAYVSYGVNIEAVRDDITYLTDIRKGFGVMDSAAGAALDELITRLERYRREDVRFVINDAYVRAKNASYKKKWGKMGKMAGFIALSGMTIATGGIMAMRMWQNRKGDPLSQLSLTPFLYAGAAALIANPKLASRLLSKKAENLIQDVRAGYAQMEPTLQEYGITGAAWEEIGRRLAQPDVALKKMLDELEKNPGIFGRDEEKIAALTDELLPPRTDGTEDPARLVLQKMIRWKDGEGSALLRMKAILDRSGEDAQDILLGYIGRDPAVFKKDDALLKSTKSKAATAPSS